MSHRALSQRLKLGRGKSTRRAAENIDEEIPIDVEGDLKDNLITILSNVSSQQSSISSGRRLGHLNNLVKLLCTRKDIFDVITLKSLLTCIKPALVNDVKEVRAACIRALRYIINDAESCKVFMELHIDYFVVKCLDISHFNEVERIQTLRLIRKIIHTLKMESENESNLVPRSLISCIIAISSDGADERDRVYRTCLAVLCELAVTHSQLFIQYGGLIAVFRAIPECHLYPRICECLILSLIHVINSLDKSYNMVNINLDSIFSFYTDLLVQRSRSDSDDIPVREEEMNFIACKTAIISALRSWSGLSYISQGNGLSSFLDALSVPNSTTIRGILSVLFELFYIPEPEWTDDFNLALKTANPSVFQESWRLSNSFIAAEAKALLPLRRKSRVDILDTYTAVLLAVFLNQGLLNNLVEVAISTDNFASVSSCVLLGGILQMCSNLLPQTGCNYANNKLFMHRECLPSLLKRSTDLTRTKEERFAAITAASRLEEIKNIYSKNSIAYSLYLDELQFRSKHYVSSNEEDAVFIDDGVTLASSQFSHMPSSSISRRSSTVHSGAGGSIHESGEIIPSIQHPPRKNRSLMLMRDFSEERILAKIKDTQVLTTKENDQWKWKAILSVLNNTYDNNMTKEYLYDINNNDSVYRFFKRLVFFYLPGSKLFSMLELARETLPDHNRDIILAGCRLMRFLLKSNQEGLTLLASLVSQIVEYLSSEVTSSGSYKKATESFGATCSREYFLLLGVLSSDTVGDQILKLSNAYTYFNSLIAESTHENIIKLLISSLQYSEYGPSREILRKVLKKCSDSCRLFATSFLRCLYRAGILDFVHWGTELITSQLNDVSNAVAMEALNILDEICDEPEYLKAVVNLGPSVLHMGDRGAMLVCRFLAYPTKPNYLSDGTYLAKELDRWWTSGKIRYVEQVEEALNVSLTSYEKPTNGNSFVRRSNVKKSKCPVRLPAHLYGELAKYRSGCEILSQENIIPKLVASLNEEYSKLKDIYTKQTSYMSSSLIRKHLLEIKSSAWALGHISSTTEGFLLAKPYNVSKILIMLAEESLCYSLRGTCIYCLSLIAQTVTGVEELAKHKWICVTQKKKPISESCDEPYTDEAMRYQYSPSVFLRSSSVRDVDLPSRKSPRKITAQFSVSTECIFNIGSGDPTHSSPDEVEAISPTNIVADLLKDDITPSNSSVALIEKDSNFYGSRNLSFNRELKSTEEKPKESVVASSNTGITAVYNIREKFKNRSASFSDTLANSAELCYSDSSINIPLENINLTKYIGLALPQDIFVLFKKSDNILSEDSKLTTATTPYGELPFLIRNAMHKKHSDSKFLVVVNDNSGMQTYNESAYIDDLEKGAETNYKMIQNEILKLTTKLGSAIGVRMHETALLTIKEKLPDVFNSLHLYNQVSEVLSLYNYRLTARRFIQELFHGMQMGEIYVDAKLAFEQFSRT